LVCSEFALICLSCWSRASGWPASALRSSSRCRS
jgi:hypothetical protein